MADEAPSLNRTRMAIRPWTRCHFFGLSPGIVCIAEVHGYEPAICGQNSATFVSMVCHPLTQLSRDRWEVKQVLLYELFKAENGSALLEVIWGRDAYGSGVFCCMSILRRWKKKSRRMGF